MKVPGYSRFKKASEKDDLIKAIILSKKSPVEDVPSVTDISEISDMGITKLKELARKLNVPYYSKYTTPTKDQLIKEILKRMAPESTAREEEEDDGEELVVVLDEDEDEDEIDEEEERRRKEAKKREAMGEAGPSNIFREDYLSSLTVAKLKAIAKDNKIKIPANAVKSKIISTIMESKGTAMMTPILPIHEDIEEEPVIQDIITPMPMLTPPTTILEPMPEPVRPSDDIKKMFTVPGSIPILEEEIEVPKTPSRASKYPRPMKTPPKRQQVPSPVRETSPIPSPEIPVSVVTEDMKAVTDDTTEKIEAMNIVPPAIPDVAPEIKADFTEENIAEILDIVEQIEDKEPITGLSVARDNIMRCLGLLM